MTIGDELGKAAEVIAPELGVPVYVTRAVIFLVILGAVLFVGWKLFFSERQAEAKHDVAAAHAQQLVGQAQADAGAHAANVVAGNAASEAKTHEITRDHYVYINQQPGAGDPVSDSVWDAFERSVCVRASAASLPDCQRLQETDPK